ncbi:MAG TPA: hypothetical protein PLO41_14470 [Rubrivivax sp.]|nr:hypothetical protein [Rubrivivax sp.]
MSATKTVAQEKVRVTADLPVGTIDILRELAASQQVTLTEALRRAIANEGLLRKRVKEDNSRVLLEAKDGKLTELLFRD